MIQGLDTDAARRALAGQDIFYAGAPVAGIARPGSVAEVQALVAAARAEGLHLVPRGGGMSYTAAIVSAAPERAVQVDMRGMAAIREINAQDMYVLVEAGCTWQALDEALAPLGLEVPFRGPVSGRLATIGGGVAQNAIFYGTGRHGTAADSVLGVEVVTGTGALVRTGSFGVAGASPFLRHFGPDLSGLFTADCGVLGVKTALALRLRRRPAARDVASFATTDLDALFGFLAALGHDGRASQVMALDVRLEGERLRQTGLTAKLDYLRTLASGPGSLAQRASEGMAMARARLRTPPGRGLAVHVFLEGPDAADCACQAASITALAEAHGLPAADQAPARAMLRLPFAPLTGLAGAPGERWVPVHFIVPHSRALDAMADIEVVIAEHADAIAAHKIKVRHLIANLGAGAVTLEPMFLWPDRLTPFAAQTLKEQGGRDADDPANAQAEAAVRQLRAAMIARLDASGALHSQLGRAYPYQPRLDDGARAVFQAVRAALDPDNIMNPGALDTPVA
ncbi:FAD-binding oxidoreductase [Polymorphobacter sp.]|uniref:FAD-binding oxidoreductase n=1 Tax=Polymorphobacter sp. TaxID=1909290 RepID=UPI003F717751